MANIRAAALVAAAIGLAWPAVAQDYAVDANNDSIVDRNEWTNYGSSTFTEYDRDDSGVLDENEFEESDAFGLGMAEGDTDSWFGDWDANNDEGLGNNEYFTESQFDEYDSNRDGNLGEDEWFWNE